MSNQKVENKLLEVFEVEELEGRFEMAKWIEFVPCECPDDEEPVSEN